MKFDWCEIFLFALSAAVGVISVVFYMEFRPIPKPDVIVHRNFYSRSDAHKFIFDFANVNSDQVDTDPKVLIVSGPNGSGKSETLTNSLKYNFNYVWDFINPGHNFSQTLKQIQCTDFNHIVVLTVAANVTKSELHSVKMLTTELPPQTKLIIILKEHMHLLTFRGVFPQGQQIIWLNHFTHVDAFEFVKSSLPIIENDDLIHKIVSEIGYHVGMLKLLTNNIRELIEIAYTRQSNMNRDIIDSIIRDEVEATKYAAFLKLQQFPFYCEYYCLFFSFLIALIICLNLFHSM
jgi:hypothetical protein